MMLVLRRALAQRRLVASVVALVAVAVSALGVCALVLGPTEDVAFSRAIQSEDAQDVDVDAFLVGVAAEDLAAVRALAVQQLREILAPLHPTVTTMATSRMRDLQRTASGHGLGVGYLATGRGITAHAELVSGRWPAATAGVTETAVPEAAVRGLDLRIGDRVTLDQASGFVGTLEPVTLVVVGTYRPRSTTGWESDLLAGAGFDPGYQDGADTTTSAGPFAVDDAAFLASGSPVARLRVTAEPDLALATRASITAAVAALTGATGRLSAQAGDRVDIARVASALPTTLAQTEDRRAAGRSPVVVAVVLAMALALLALLVAGRLVATVRDDERAWLVSLGVSPRQQLRAAGVEALLLAVVAAIVGLPTSSLLHSWLTHAAGPAAAGLSQSPKVTLGQMVAVLAGALALVPALVVTARDATPSSAATRRRWALARSGADLTLVAVAVAVAGLAWSQLRTQPPTAAAHDDVTLILAPVVCLLLATAVVVRLVPSLLQAGSRAALRSRSLVLPLSAQQVARRPHAGTAMVLIAGTVAAASFGLGLRSTWEQAQADQAVLQVGTDLDLRLPDTSGVGVAGGVAGGVTSSAAATRAGRAVLATAARAGAPAISPVIEEPLSLGGYVGDPDDQPVIVAVDSGTAGAVLRGRTGSGPGWDTVGLALQPGSSVRGLRVAAGMTLRGESSSTQPVRATATAVLQDDDGLRTAVGAAPVALDGRDHPLTWDGAAVDGQLVALSLHLAGPPPADAGPTDPITDTGVDVVTTVTLPDATPTTEWQTRAVRDGPLRAPSVAVLPDDEGVRLRASATVDALGLSEQGADLLTTSFPAPDEVPVAVSASVARAVGARVGTDLAGVVGAAELPLHVVAVVPTIPSAPGRLAVLADADAVSRGLIASGQLDSPVAGWWVGDPDPQAVRALRALHLGSVVTRSQRTAELRRAPLQVTVPTMLIALVAAASVLLFAGVALVTGSDQRRRQAELARLRALGLSRRGAHRLLLVEHAAFLGPLALIGVVLGALATAVLAPLMVRSEVGTATVPPPLAEWPWRSEAVLIGGLLLGATVVVALFTTLQVRASDRTALRTGEV